MKYNTLEYESHGERSCYTVGKVYRSKDVDTLPDNTLLLCIRKNGDCFYNFVALKYRTTTSGYPFVEFDKLQNYYDVGKRVNAYGGLKEAFPNMRAFEPYELVHILYSEQVLIPVHEMLNDEGKQKLKEVEELKGKMDKLNKFFQSNEIPIQI